MKIMENNNNELLNKMFNDSSLKVQDPSAELSHTFELLDQANFFGFQDIGDTFLGMYIATYDTFDDWKIKDKIKTLHLFKTLMEVKVVIKNEEKILPVGSLVKINGLTQISKSLESLNKGTNVAIRFTGKKKLANGYLKIFDIRSDNQIQQDFKNYENYNFNILTLAGYKNANGMLPARENEENEEDNIASYAPQNTQTIETPFADKAFKNGVAVDVSEKSPVNTSPESINLDDIPMETLNPQYEAILALATSKLKANKDNVRALVLEKTGLDMAEEKNSVSIITVLATLN